MCTQDTRRRHLFHHVDEPMTFGQVEHEACWRKAMTEELKAIEGNETLELTTLPIGHRAIEPKWVFKVKRDEAGNIVCHKGRLVAKGYM